MMLEREMADAESICSMNWDADGETVGHGKGWHMVYARKRVVFAGTRTKHGRWEVG
jgi:hypothetical protein